MIHRYQIPDGVRLVADPFSVPNKNAACQIIAEVKSLHGDRSDARMEVVNLKWMKIGDAAILINALRAMIEEAQNQLVKVREKAGQPKKEKRK